MKFRFLLRFTLAVVFAFVGALIAKTLNPQPVGVGIDYFLIAAILAFATFGFILPEIAEFAGKAGIAVLARQIATHIQTSALGKISKPTFGLARRNSKNKYTNPILVDTSVLIDGRLAEVCRTGFLFGTLLVLPSVISELHTLADSSDKLKRARGRRGLDELAGLRSEKQIKVEVLGREAEGKDVDSRLVATARLMRAKLLTVDFNLNKVAKVSKVTVLNLNELASAAKTVVLPGERLMVQIISRGEQRRQGVGYLDDGTMVVVEEAANFVGKKADVVVEKVLTTAAGKMIFGKVSL